MTIRTRLILSFTGCLMLFCAGIYSVSHMYLGKISEQSFATQAHNHLSSVEDKINTFIAPAVMSLDYLAALPFVRNSFGQLSSFVDTTEKTYLYFRDQTPYEQRLYDEFMTEMRSKTTYDLIFMANHDGQYLQAPEGRYKNPGYDPRVRSWFKELLASPNDLVVSEPYRTTGAGVVSSVMKKTYAPDGTFLGMVGVDYKLSTLIADIDTRRIMTTGRVLVLNSKGEAIGAEQEDLSTVALAASNVSLGEQIAQEPDGAWFVSLATGASKYVVSYSLSSLNLRLAVVFDEAEVTKTRDAFLRMLLLCGTVAFVFSMCIILRVSGNVVKPIEELIDASSIISKGDYEQSEDIQEVLRKKLSVKGIGETALLAQSLNTLVDTLQDRIVAAEAASKAKVGFLSNMSHEMRTPLNAIMGMTAIGNTANTLERKDYAFKKIGDAASHLLGVVNDVLDMSMLESNKLELLPREFSFEGMMRGVADFIRFRMDEKQLNFNIKIDNVPDALVGDEQRIFQVISELLGNAVKFTPAKGTIDFTASLQEETDGFCTIFCIVADSGIGIGKDQQTRLFQVFQQVDNSSSRAFGGAGLGLAIAERIVKMMQGSIWLESELGKGSTFGFSIRLARGDSAEQAALHENDWGSLRLLFVDGNAEFLDTASRITASLNIPCDTASTAREMLALLGKDHTYDIVFISKIVSGMFFLDLVAEVKRRNPEGHVILVASAAEWISFAPDAAQAGVSGSIAKPLFRSDLLACIREHMGQKTAQEQPKGSEAPAVFFGKRILIVDDVSLNREICMAILEPMQLEMDCAENGAQALRLFNDNQGHYHLILMDLQMPEMDGLEASRSIRAIGTQEALTIPIIAITANTFRDDVEKCLAAGMNDHIPKPLDAGVVYGKVAFFLSRIST